jgi:hypothetical protein
MIKIFISYAKEDKAEAENIFHKLKSIPNVEPWIDTQSILPGQKWKSAINNAINDAHLFIALFSNNSISKKGYVQKEIREALEVYDKIPEGHIYLIPIRLEDCVIPYQKIKEIQYLDFYPDKNIGIQKLIKLISSIPSFNSLIKKASLILESSIVMNDELLLIHINELKNKISILQRKIITTLLPLAIDSQGLSEVYKSGEMEKFNKYLNEVLPNIFQFPEHLKQISDEIANFELIE